MVDKQELLDRIEDMNEAGDEIRWRHKKEIEDLIQDIFDDLKSLYDYTFINVPDANKVIYLRDNIEDGLKKWEARGNE